MSEDEKLNEEPGKKKPPMSDYARYSGVGFQMLVTILIGVFAGKKLDQLIGMKFPIFTLLLTLASVGAAMYFIIKEFTGKK